MKVMVKESIKLNSDEVCLLCYKSDERIGKITAYIRNMDKDELVAKDQEKIFKIALSDVYYFESIDKKTFAYLKDKVLETALRLYEIEEKYQDKMLFRAGKSIIVNLKYIQSASPMLNRNLLVALKNNEKIVISRRYVKDFNQMIGMEG